MNQVTDVSRFTRHALQKLSDLHKSHGITWANVEQALRARAKPSRLYAHQYRLCGGGVCLVCDEYTGTVITAYIYRVLTPLRPDQIAAGVTINRKG